MILDYLTDPPFPWLKEAVGIDTLGTQPVMVRTRRIRGRLRHDRIATLPGQPAAACIGCLANRESVIRRLEAPFTSQTKARRVFPALLDLRLPFAESDCERVFLDPRPTDQGGIETLAVAARRAAITARAATVQALGGDPLLLDQEALALWTQSLLEVPPTPDQQPSSRVVIALYDQGATLCSGHGQRLETTGNLSEAGAADIDRRLTATGIAADQPLEIRWTGPAAADEARVPALIAELDILRPARHVRHAEPAAMLARALTTRALTRGPLRCNLRTGSLLHPALRRRTERQVSLCAGIAALTGVALMATGWLWQVRNRDHAQRLHDQITIRAINLSSGVAGLRGTDAVVQAQRHVAQHASAARTLADLAKPATWDGLIEIVQAAGEHDVRIHQLALQESGPTLDGSAADWERVIAFTRRLEQLTTGNLSLRRQWDAETDDNRVIFRVDP